MDVSWAQGAAAIVAVGSAALLGGMASRIVGHGGVASVIARRWWKGRPRSRPAVPQRSGKKEWMRG